MAKILFDAKPLTTGHSKRGVGRYVKGLLSSLLNTDTENEYIILTTKDKNTLQQILGDHPPTKWNIIKMPHLHRPERYGFLIDHLTIPFIINKVKPDIYFSTDFFAHPYSKRSKVKYIGVLYNVLPPSLTPITYNIMPYSLKLAWNMSLNNLKNYDRVITISDFCKSEIIDQLRIPEEKISCVYAGYEPTFSPDDSAEQTNNFDILSPFGIRSPYFLYVGDTDGRKNIFRMLDAIQKSRVLDNVQFVFVGPSTQKDKIFKQLIEDFHSSKDKIIILPYVGDKVLCSLYRKAIALVFPTLYEGFGLPVLEAMVCGCPVLVSSSSALPEVVGDAGIYVDPYNVQEIADGMKRLLEDSDLRIEMRKKGIKQAEKFKWENSARDLIRIFKE